MRMDRLLRKDQWAAAVAAVISLIALAAAVPISMAQSGLAPAQTDQPDNASPAVAADIPLAVTVLNNHEVEGVLGQEVRSSADENMGRIVDVVVDRAGHVRAAVIDFGGFLGVGNRKIAVDWNTLSFLPPGHNGRVTVELTRDHVKAAPEYQEGKPVVVQGAEGKLEPFSIQ
jgi:PRC-barrel domain